VSASLRSFTRLIVTDAMSIVDFDGEFLGFGVVKLLNLWIVDCRDCRDCSSLFSIICFAVVQGQKYTLELRAMI
jgi:hypothetical protein